MSRYDRLLTTGEAARWLGFEACDASRRRIRRLIRSGELAGENHAPDGHRPDWRVRLSALEAYRRKFVRDDQS